MNIQNYLKSVQNISIVQRNLDVRKITLEASFYDKETNSHLSMLSDGEIVNRPVKKGEKAYRFVFTQKPLMFDLRNAMDKEKVQILLKHPKCFVAGAWDENENLNCDGEGDVYVVSASRDAKYMAQETKILLAIANRVNSMSYEEMWNACYLIGYNPLGKTEDMIFSALYDHSQNDPVGFAEILDDTNKEKNIVIKKALSLGVIERKRNNYYWGQEIVGQTEDDILGYCVMNPEQYKGIRNQVAKKDHLPVSVNKIEKPKAKSKKVAVPQVD